MMTNFEKIIIAAIVIYFIKDFYFDFKIVSYWERQKKIDERHLELVEINNLVQSEKNSTERTYNP